MSVRRAALLAVSLSALALPSAHAARPPVPGGGGSRCDAIVVNGTPTGEVRSIVAVGGISAITHARRYGTNAALWTSVRGLGCDEARRFLATVLLAPDERVALGLAGWRVTRIDRFRADGVRVHQVWAVQGAKRIIYVRRGDNPRLSRAVYRPGQHLGFPKTHNECTSGFLVRSRVDGALFALTAGHCSAYPVFSAAGAFETEDVHLVMPGNEPLVLGTVAKNVRTEANGPDALVFAVHGARLAAQEISRGSRPPRPVAGVLPRSRQHKGRVVCFTGFVSGVDKCGRIHGQSTFPNPNPVICARGTTSHHGDSGGPVYTEPDSRGRVYAVGVEARSSVGGLNRDMCYTPIQTVLEAFGAELPTGAFAIPAPPPPPPGS